MPVGPDLVGRILDGMGRPLDGGPPLLPEAERDLNGLPVNPVARAHPAEFIETGHLGDRRAATRSSAARSCRSSPASACRPASWPRRSPRRRARAAASASDVRRRLRRDRRHRSRGRASSARRFAEGAALERSVLFLNRADEPAAERLTDAARRADGAEYLAFERGLHVLVVLVDMTNYCEALRELAAARDEVPGRRGYPGYMYSDLASLFERAGRIRGRPGSVTQIPILSMPDDDVTHPIPDVTGYITEGQIVLSRELDRRGIAPPIDVLPSLSRLMNAGIGAGQHARGPPRRRRPALRASSAAAASCAASSRSSASRRSPTTTAAILAFADDSSSASSARATQRRSIEQTLDLAWELLALLPRPTSSESTRAWSSATATHARPRVRRASSRCMAAASKAGRVSGRHPCVMGLSAHSARAKADGACLAGQAIARLSGRDGVRARDTYEDRL